MRSPAAVLIDRELQIAPRRQFDELAPVVEVFDERLLRQDVLSRIQRAAHKVDANVRVGRDVENPQARILQEGLKIAGDARLREIRVATRLCALKIARADRHDLEPMARVSVEMRAADAAGADESDRCASVARHWRKIGQVRRLRLRRGLGDKRVVVRGRFAGLPRRRRAHGNRASVRRSRAESAAVSTMR